MTLALPADTLDPISGNSDVPLVETPRRIVSVDAMRGFVMLTMIFVNDLNGDVAPWWMKHWSETGFAFNGLTFVDLVFPSFLFLVGMSIPLAFVGRLKRGVSIWNLVGHVILRTLALLAIGIMMVNTEETANNALMPMRAVWWEGLMFICAILAFCRIGHLNRGDGAKIATWILRGIGGVGLIYLALVYRFDDANGTGHRLLQLHPFHLHQSWYGILGLIGWAYLTAAVVFALFRTRRLPILTCVVLLFTSYVLEQNGEFSHLHRLMEIVDIGQMIGTHGGIATAGLLLGTVLLTADTATHRQRLMFGVWFAIGFAAAALIISPPLPIFKTNMPLFGVGKNAATPAWGLWSAAAAATVWIVFYLIADVWRQNWLAKPWAVAGQNVLLAYLLSEGFASWIRWAHLLDWYERLGEPDLTHAVLRSLGLGVVLLAITALLNRVGFSVRL